MNKKRITGYGYLNEPKYNWHCPKCQFIVCIQIFIDNGDYIYTDIYKSCSSEEGEFIFVHSNGPGDYSSSITMNILFAHYIISGVL